MTIYLQSTLTCHGAGLGEFLETMAEIKPIVEAAGWKLDRAYIQRTGRLNVVIDIWELEDFNHFDVGIGALTVHPRFSEFKDVLDRCLISEELVYLTKAAYSP